MTALRPAVGAAKHQRYLLIHTAIVLLAVLVRLIPGQSAVALSAQSDGAHYERIAVSLLDGRGFGEIPGFKTAHRAPLQPAFLAATYAALGRSWRAGVVSGALLAGLTVVATALLAAGICGRRAGLLAALATALYPRHVDYTVRLWSLSEALFVALLVAALATWWRAERHSSWRFAGVAGVLFALACLTRPIVLLLPFLLVFRIRATRTLVVAVAVASYTLTIAPWTARNYLMFNRFVPVSTMTGIVLFQSFHPSDEGWGMTPWAEIHALTAGLPSEVEVSDYLVRHTIGGIVADPLSALALLPSKLLSLFNPLTEWGIDATIDRTFVVVLLTGAAGAWRSRYRRACYVPFLTIGYLVFGAIAFYGSARFRFPLEPILTAFSAVWASRMCETFRGRQILSVVVALTIVCSMVTGLDRAHARSVRDRLESVGRSIRPD